MNHPRDCRRLCPVPVFGRPSLGGAAAEPTPTSPFRHVSRPRGVYRMEQPGGAGPTPSPASAFDFVGTSELVWRCGYGRKNASKRPADQGRRQRPRDRQRQEGGDAGMYSGRSRRDLCESLQHRLAFHAGCCQKDRDNRRGAAPFLGACHGSRLLIDYVRAQSEALSIEANGARRSISCGELS